MQCRLLLSNEKKWAIDTYNSNGSQEHNAEWGKKNSKYHIVYYSISTTVSKWQNYRVGEQISGC